MADNVFSSATLCPPEGTNITQDIDVTVFNLMTSLALIYETIQQMCTTCVQRISRDIYLLPC